MKITYLKICNYKSIEQLEITDIENALILVGKNNTGKTAVIDAILLAMGMRNCAEHEFLDAGKPISISVHIEYSESDIMLLHSRRFSEQDPVLSGWYFVIYFYRHTKYGNTIFRWIFKA